MRNANEKITNWVETASEYSLPEWDALPSIPLYMDQVMMFTSDALALFARDEKQDLLTNSMINNYVKSGLVEHPVHKRYAREQLAQIVMTGLLKQVLSIQDLNVLLGGSEETEALYGEFTKAQNSALHEIAELVRTEMDEDNLRSLAMRLAAEANARRAVAERILWELSSGEEQAAGQKKGTDKQKR